MMLTMNAPRATRLEPRETSLAPVTHHDMGDDSSENKTDRRSVACRHGDVVSLGAGWFTYAPRRFCHPHESRQTATLFADSDAIDVTRLLTAIEIAEKRFDTRVEWQPPGKHRYFPCANTEVDGRYLDRLKRIHGRPTACPGAPGRYILRQRGISASPQGSAIGRTDCPIRMLNSRAGAALMT